MKKSNSHVLEFLENDARQNTDHELAINSFSKKGGVFNWQGCKVSGLVVHFSVFVKLNLFAFALRFLLTTQ